MRGHSTCQHSVDRSKSHAPASLFGISPWYQLQSLFFVNAPVAWAIRRNLKLCLCGEFDRTELVSKSKDAFPQDFSGSSWKLWTMWRVFSSYLIIKIYTAIIILKSCNRIKSREMWKLHMLVLGRILLRHLRIDPCQIHHKNIHSHSMNNYNIIINNNCQHQIKNILRLFLQLPANPKYHSLKF
jgi:hypothetical protein